MKEVAANRSRVGWSVTKEVSEDWDNQYITVLRHLVTAATKNEDSIEESIRAGLTSGEVNKINFAFREFVKVTDIRTQ